MSVKSREIFLKKYDKLCRKKGNVLEVYRIVIIFTILIYTTMLKCDKVMVNLRKGDDFH